MVVIIVFTVSVLTISFTFNYFQLGIVGEVIGYLSLISEVINIIFQSMIMVPQVIENQRQRRVKGLSHLLVACNNIGDSFKLIYFIIKVKPINKKGTTTSIYYMRCDTNLCWWICGYSNIVLWKWRAEGSWNHMQSRIATLIKKECSDDWKVCLTCPRITHT